MCSLLSWITNMTKNLGADIPNYSLFIICNVFPNELRVYYTWASPLFNKSRTAYCSWFNYYMTNSHCSASHCSYLRFELKNFNSQCRWPVIGRTTTMIIDVVARKKIHLRWNPKKCSNHVAPYTLINLTSRVKLRCYPESPKISNQTVICSNVEWAYILEHS